MNNYYHPFNATNPQAAFQQIQQMFPQPQGSVYSINSPLDIGNVPIGSTGLSIALCMPEQLMYIKSFQNGNPIVMAYRVSPFQKNSDQKENVEPKPDKDIMERLALLEEKINKLTSSGGKFDELL